MRPGSIAQQDGLTEPVLQKKAVELAAYLKTLSLSQIGSCMHLSKELAATTKQLIDSWDSSKKYRMAAIDCFLGDIYSGLQSSKWSKSDRSYAQSHLVIISGLYGALRPLDEVMAYRLEMGYRLPALEYRSLYSFWGDRLVSVVPDQKLVINLTSKEYARAILPYLESARIISPSFLTLHPITKQPTFVAVHSKIARGAFADWLITNRIKHPTELSDFSAIGYHYDQTKSTDDEPVFIANEFLGKGLSIRLS
jgi:cytoplasmic iron level regulating protein YaaA (DUF328/UPF0246 family)